LFHNIGLWIKSKKQAICFFAQVSVEVISLSYVLILVRISAETPAILTEGFRDFTLPSKQMQRVSRLGNDGFVLNSSLIHVSTIGRYADGLVTDSVIKKRTGGGGGEKGRGKV
jgi:hypothetical protein